jgi:hypothetical protein
MRTESSVQGAGAGGPIVSVLMPTFKHGAFIRRALESLFAQTFSQWELVVVDDGSPDDTAALLAPYLDDPRVRYTRLERNTGLGAALNTATALARGRYLAYLPSDDLYYPDHLATLVNLLDTRPDVSLAHADLRYGYHHFGPAPTPPIPHSPSTPLPHSLRMVQVLHRRGHEAELRWPTRAEHESDALEGDHWAALAERGGVAGSGAVTCEWVDHAGQRTKLIAPPAGGLSRYRAHYELGRGQWVNFQPERGWRIDERRRFGRFAADRELPAPGGLRILLVGELGFNPERILAFEEQGHKLHALWVPAPEGWDTAGPLPYGNVDVIPYGPGWRERVRAARPDVIYALLNWQAVSLIDEVLSAGLGVPLVFHFKEGPFICYEKGLWPVLVRILRGSAGVVWLNEETRAWFRLALGDEVAEKPGMLLDGDLPKADWFAGAWAPRLSGQDGQIHTVCPGRPLGLEPFEEIAAAGIHVHLYGEQFHQVAPNLVRAGLATGHMHLHPSVGPEQWVSELSRYDAAWLHLFDSRNQGDLRRALWDDLNLPARLGTYAAAGLPWIMRDNAGHAVAPQRLAADLGVGLPFRSYDELAGRLRDRRLMERLTANMRNARHGFAFDSHVEALVGLFRAVTRR